MKINSKKIIAVISAAAAALSALTPVYADRYYDDEDFPIYTDDFCYPYEPPYDPRPARSCVSVSAVNSPVNPDNGEYLHFTVTNTSGNEISVTNPASDGFVQKYTSEGWVTVNGGAPVPVPYYEDDDEYDFGYYENTDTIPPYSSITEKLYVGDLEDGSYRLGFYVNGYYGAVYVDFTVMHSVSAELTENDLFTGDDMLNIRLTSNLPLPAEIALDSDLAVLEKYSGGKWKAIDPEYDYSDLDDLPALLPGQTYDYEYPLDMYGDLGTGRYRLTFGWSVGDDMPEDYPESLYGSIILKFTVSEPVTVSVIPSSATRSSDMYLNLKIKNNTDKAITLTSTGSLKKLQGTRWAAVKPKRRAKDTAVYKRIAPNDTETLRIYFADYYNTSTLARGTYRAEIPVNGEMKYIRFEIKKNKIYIVQ